MTTTTTTFTAADGGGYGKPVDAYSTKTNTASAARRRTASSSSSIFQPTQLLAACNYCILFAYACFITFAAKADASNLGYLWACLVLGTLCAGTAVIGLVGVTFRIEAAIRGTFTLLILEHLIGFIMGALLLVECFYKEAHPAAHHSARVALYFLHKSRPLAIVFGCLLILLALAGCLTISYVADWQTDIEADQYLQSSEHVSLLKGSRSPYTTSYDSPSYGRSPPPPPPLLTLPKRAKRSDLGNDVDNQDIASSPLPYVVTISDGGRGDGIGDVNGFAMCGDDAPPTTIIVDGNIPPNTDTVNIPPTTENAISPPATNSGLTVVVASECMNTRPTDADIKTSEMDVIVEPMNDHGMSMDTADYRHTTGIDTADTTTTTTTTGIHTADTTTTTTGIHTADTTTTTTGIDTADTTTAAKAVGGGPIVVTVNTYYTEDGEVVYSGTKGVVGTADDVVKPESDEPTTTAIVDAIAVDGQQQQTESAMALDSVKGKDVRNGPGDELTKHDAEL